MPEFRLTQISDSAGYLWPCQARQGAFGRLRDSRPAAGSDRDQGVGLVEYRFRPDSFEVRYVRAPGQTDVGLDELRGAVSNG